MQTFFRRYQKFLYIFISFILIISFVFTSALNAFLDASQQRADRVVGKSIDGSDLKLLEISALSRFLASDRDDIANGGTPNLLNDGVIRKDLMISGIAEMLVKENFDVLKNGLAEKVQKIKSYRGYEHPEAPFVSAKSVWQRISPDACKLWTALQTAETVDPTSFGQIARLYQLQSTLPPEWLRKILMMQEQQHKQWLQPDPQLRQEDLSLFGFHSLFDWFGKNFVDLMAQFIHNAAIVAEEKGYRVSREEAKGDMKRTFAQTSQKLQEAKWAGLYSYQDQLRMLEIDESDAITAWQKVLLFRAYFQDMCNSTFMDRMPYSEFASVASEQASVDLYQWPESLKLTSAFDLLCLETYVESVAQKSVDILSLPNAFFSTREVELRAPELVATRYSANVYAVDKREASLRAPLKEVWKFETDAPTWDLLKKEFPFLQIAKTAAERFDFLDKLVPSQRTKVDLFARRLLIEKHPEWVKDALDAAQGKQTELVLSAGAIHLPHVKDPVLLASLFQEILTAPEFALTELQQFESGDAVFRFENIEKITDASIKTFKEAISDGSLTRMVDKILQANFQRLKPQLAADKVDRSLEEVKEEISLLLLKKLKAAVDKEKIEGESFAVKRMVALASRAREDLMINPHESKWLRQEGESPLTAQFKLDCIEKQISRSADEHWLSKELFDLKPHHWTPIQAAADGGIAFTYLKNRQIIKKPVLDKLNIGKEKIGADIQCLLAEKIVARMQAKRAIIIPLQPEME
jgi:hypothetical protein